MQEYHRKTFYTILGSAIIIMYDCTRAENKLVIALLTRTVLYIPLGSWAIRPEPRSTASACVVCVCV